MHMHDTMELHLAGLSRTTSHPGKLNIRIIGFFFENRVHWQFEVEKNFYGSFRIL